MKYSEQVEEIAMTIIANSGTGRSAAFEALELAKEGKFEDADELLMKAKSSFLAAHEAHRKLLKMDACGEIPEMGALLTHAQDHLMTSTLAEELIREIILLYRNK